MCASSNFVLKTHFIYGTYADLWSQKDLGGFIELAELEVNREGLANSLSDSSH